MWEIWIEMVNELTVEKLRRECDTSFMRCDTTHQLVPLQGIIGQERAVRALKFGLGHQRTRLQHLCCRFSWNRQKNSCQKLRGGNSSC